jgi:serine/threonine-protein kinase
MCTVWVAMHTGLDRRVALKFLRSDLPETEEGRLLREARALGRIEHPAVIRVFDYGETDARHPFIVMELLEGSSLAYTLSKGRLSPIAACRVLLPIIDGLSVVHEAGIVHRDLKPENIFLARETGRIQPKLLDFGIAKFETRDPKPRLTMSGTVLGSPAYMAPEQARGQGDVDHRSDLWAACLVLYEAVSGRTPFNGDNYNAVLRSIVEDEIPPLVERGAGESILWSIIARGLAKKREQRIQSARELCALLSRFLLERGIDSDITGVPLGPLCRSEPVAGDAPQSSEPDSARTLDPPEGSHPVVLTSRGDRHRHPPALSRPLTMALVAGAAALLVPTSFLATMSRTHVGAGTAHHSTEMAVTVAQAASPPVKPVAPGVSAIQPSAVHPIPVDANLVVPPSRQEARRGGEEAASTLPSKPRVERPKSPEPSKPSADGTASEDALRALGLKAPYP